ncbi:MAG: hypothetical protein ACXAC7_00600 [Candidatus Hodarchaeales archaeon]|jgi:hypothetical protein
MIEIGILNEINNLTEQSDYEESLNTINIQIKEKNYFPLIIECLSLLECFVKNIQNEKEILKVKLNKYKRLFKNKIVLKNKEIMTQMIRADCQNNISNIRKNRLRFLDYSCMIKYYINLNNIAEKSPHGTNEINPIENSIMCSVIETKETLVKSQP